MNTEAKDPLEVHRAAIREAGSKITPYRIGKQVGVTGIGLDAPCPYLNRHSRRQYKDGIAFGEMIRKQQATS